MADPNNPMFPTSISMLNLIVVGQTVTAHYVDPPEKIDPVEPLRPAFQGHSVSSKVIRIDQIPMTFC